MRKTTPVCWQNHMGPWAIEADWFARAFALVKSGAWQPQVELAGLPRVTLGGELKRAAPVLAFDDEGFGEAQDPTGAEYVVTEGGVAILELLGPIMKARSKFGGTSSVGTRRALQAAVADPNVRAIMLHVESPGGTVAGTPELADAVAAADKQKPVHAFIEDLGASAAVWIAFQARRVTANQAAQVGSIGAFSVLEDVSKVYEAAGVRVHVLATGPDKGVGVEGAPITEAQLAPFREFVAHAGEMFFAAVAKGRGLTEKRLAAVTSGRTWSAPQAAELHLLDGVEGWAAAMKSLSDAGDAAAKLAGRPARSNRARAALATARLVRVRAAALGAPPSSAAP